MPGKNSADGRAVHALAFSAWFSATMPTMKRIQAFKFRLVPTPEQERLLSRHAGCVRFVWNKALVPLFPRRQADETGRTPGPGRSPEHEPDLLRLWPCVAGQPEDAGGVRLRGLRACGERRPQCGQEYSQGGARPLRLFAGATRRVRGLTVQVANPSPSPEGELAGRNPLPY